MKLFDVAHPPGFLLPAERNLMHHFMMLHQDAFAWNDTERGHFREDFFPPVEIPVIPHRPWIVKNCPIPPGIYNELCKLLQKKIAHSGVPPFTDQVAEQFAALACVGLLDLFVGYDERALAEASQDYTTFQTPFGALRLTTLPMYGLDEFCSHLPRRCHLYFTTRNSPYHRSLHRRRPNQRPKVSLYSS